MRRGRGARVQRRAAPFRFDLAEFGLAEFFDPQKGSPPKLPEKIRHGKKA
jgi:hypothetical protein